MHIILTACTRAAGRSGLICALMPANAKCTRLIPRGLRDSNKGSHAGDLVWRAVRTANRGKDKSCEINVETLERIIIFQLNRTWLRAVFEEH